MSEKPKTPPQQQSRPPESRPEDEDEVEISSEDSFPASDPPSYSPISHTGKPRHDEGQDKKPKP